jgi:hypothetical protein
MRVLLKFIALMLIAAPAMVQDQAREAALDRRTNNIRAVLGVVDAAKGKAMRAAVADYYTVGTKADGVLLAKLSEQTVADKVQQEKQRIAKLLAMPLTGDEKDLSAADVEYTKAIAGRADKIVQTLAISEAAKSHAVHLLIINQYRALHDNDAVLDAGDQRMSARKILHDAYLNSLEQYLTPDQIEKVKDGHTSGKVDFTFRGYQQEYPNMTDEQKAKVVEFLKEARELGMDGGDSKEKDAIFNKYKGKINNWLSSQGVKSKKQIQKEAQATTQPAN